MDGLQAGLAGWLGGADGVFDEPVYDRLRRESRPGRQVVVRADEVVIIEGVPVLLPYWSTDRPVVRIWAQCDEGARAARVEDDLVRRGVATVSQAREIRIDRDADEAAIVLDGKDVADLVIQTDELMLSGS